MRTALRSREKTVYRVLNAGILAGMILPGWQSFFGAGELGLAKLSVALVTLAAFSGLHFMAARGRGFCLSALSAVFAAGALAACMGDGAMAVEGFFSWLAGRGAAAGREFGYGLVWTGFLTGMCYLAQLLFEKLWTLKAAAGMLAFLAVAFSLFGRRELNRYGVAFWLVFCVIVWTEWIQGRWRKRRSPGSGREAHTLWIMPFLAAYLALLAIMPAPSEPYDWQWAKNVGGWLRESVLTQASKIKWGGREGFDMAFTGFSEEGGLHGGLREEAERIMRVRINWNAFGNARGNLYLTGKVYDAFDGRGWSQKWQGQDGAAFWDTAETLGAVRRYREERPLDYLREASLEIRYEDFSTEYAFSPLKTWRVGGAEQSAYACVGGSLRWTRQKGYGTEYTLRYFRMNAGQREFDRFLEEAGSGSQGNIQSAGESREKDSGEALAGALMECEPWNGGVVTEDDVLRYREEIYENYLGEVKLSPEVSGYLREITKDAQTNVEKLKEMERALRTFSYTLTPGELPDWVTGEEEFMDYFLLESRQGYCAYFATAFVLFARAQGIPARYVQGYCVPMPKSGEAYVDSSMAHAWPEAYLSGVGWIPFEPTPGYEDKRYAPWELETMSPGQEESQTSDEESGREEALAGKAPEAENSLEEEGGVRLFALWKFLGVGVFAFLTLGVTALAAECALRRRRYQRMNLCDKFRVEVFRNLEILSWLGVRKEAWETLQELRERVERLPGLEGPEEPVRAGESAGTLRFMEDYERIAYGGAEAAEDMLDGAARARKRLLSLLKKEKKWAYFCCLADLFLGRRRFRFSVLKLSSFPD